MEKILIVSTGKYPNGNAGAIRQHSFAKLFERCGYSPYVIGLGESTDFAIKEYDGINYTSFRSKKNNIFNRILNLLLFKARLKRFLKNNTGFSKIMVVSIPIPALFYLKRYSIKKGIELIHDSVEWYSPEEFTLGKISLPYIVNNSYNTKWIDSGFKVVAISKFLQNHFTLRKVSVIRIPVILDIHNMPHKKRNINNKLVLIYAGAVGKKDYLKEIINGLALLNTSELMKLEMRLFGISNEQLKNELGIPTEIIVKLSSSLKCFGRVPREEVLKNLEEADFTVLLRPSEQRYAKAGFPTKVVESLASGTPIITNLSSDLSNYLIDMENSILVDDCSSESFRDALQKAINLNLVDKQEMQKNARKTSEKYFDYNNYIDEIKQLLESK
ncbi:glycosyltransferase [Heyndrickxia sp. NPDC080065]|uniref:glycosyltransferase n=1 Tax=Heyndrickxia sp. NPDC080065 TaxID=3390568 RepID=UPI003D0831BD